MSAVTGHRPDSINELVRILREQADVDALRISNLQRELIEARQRIIDQQRLLARLLERGGTGGAAATPLPPQLAYPVEVRARPISPIASIPPVSPAPPRVTRAERTILPEESNAFPEVKASPPSVRSDNQVQQAPAIPEKREPPRAQLPPIQVPQIGIVASTVLSAVVRQESEGEDGSADAESLAVHLPTSGRVRTAAGLAMDDLTGDMEPHETEERTLKMDRRALRRGHDAITGESGRPRWLRLRR